MLIKNKAITIILLKILKDFFISHTVTSLANKLRMTRVGTWKILKRLESENLIILDKIGKGKTNAYTVTLNRNNSLLEKILALYLTEEALEYERWRFNFSKLEEAVDFLILFGSILHFPKEANDIDILTVVKTKNFVKVDKLLLDIQQALTKKIHSINFTEIEFKKEIKKPNRAILEAVKKGVILFGQENFIRLIKEI